MSGHSVPRRWLLIVLVPLVVTILIVVGATKKPKANLRRPAPLHPGARRTLLAFQGALENQAWEQALSFCSDSVKEVARGYDSAEAFFRDVVPVDQFTALYRFDTAAISYKGTRRLIVSGYRWRVPVTIDSEESPVSQKYEIMHQNGKWEIRFPCEPLDAWLKQVYQRREALRGQIAELGKASAKQAAVERGEAEPTDEFLAQRQKEGLTRRQERTEQQRKKRLLREQRVATLLQRVKGVEVVLRGAKHACRLSGPVPLTVELVNNANSTLYYQFGGTGHSLTVLDDRGRMVVCNGSHLPTNATAGELDPGQRVVLCEGFDVGATHAIDRAGRYSVEFNGRGLLVGDQESPEPDPGPAYAPVDWISNTVEIEVLP